MLYNNLANLKSSNQKEEAEKLYRDALKTYKELAEKNPGKYSTYVAMTCNNLAVLYQTTGRYGEAEKLYTEALGIRRRLAEENPGAYLPDVAMTCYNLAILYENTGKNDAAGRLFDEALSIAKQYPDNPDCRQIIEALI